MSQFKSSTRKSLWVGALAVLLLVIVSGCSGSTNDPAPNAAAQPGTSQGTDENSKTDETATGGLLYMVGRLP
ncbi:hypothetical protein PTQ21_17950 [Paenibacillus marchantiae]|uniref:hypothetical protein n=1 Tax=Paenibacillus marchantiae TaxID=3026433 RepID=UPI00237C44D0|nr:hypothetical protein [Paenibacillus marchantiae]WDQ30333.1 hypothetical protein PTQ21_17950 [Paenibacillus marchantiae]